MWETCLLRKRRGKPPSSGPPRPAPVLPDRGPGTVGLAGLGTWGHWCFAWLSSLGWVEKGVWGSRDASEQVESAHLGEGLLGDASRHAVWKRLTDRSPTEGQGGSVSSPSLCPRHLCGLQTLAHALRWCQLWPELRSSLDSLLNSKGRPDPGNRMT